MRRVNLFLCVVAVLLSVPGFANAIPTELITNGNLETAIDPVNYPLAYSGWFGREQGWTSAGSESNHAVQDVAPHGTLPDYWYGYSSVAGQVVTQSDIHGVVPGLHYTISGDVEAWTDGTSGTNATTKLSLFLFNHATYAWSEAASVSYTNDTSTIGWQHISSDFVIPSDAIFDRGEWGWGTGPLFAITTSTNGVAGWAFDNLSVTVPEPSTIALLVSGLVGMLAYAWRKRR